MTKDKCREVARFYRENLIRFFAETRYINAKRCTIEPCKIIEERERIIAPWLEADEKRAIAHLLYMLGEMERFLDEGRMEKFFRWLGFIQGVCWVLGYQNLEELKNLNKPPDPDTGEATVGDPSTAEIAI